MMQTKHDNNNSPKVYERVQFVQTIDTRKPCRGD